ncbi:MAG: hypothetical protein IJ568_04425 [Bacilli bacterium]|nr:hypothetical protein [Bacilli bacterium]
MDNNLGKGIPNPALIGRETNIEMNFDSYKEIKNEYNEPLEILPDSLETREVDNKKDKLVKVKELLDTYNHYTNLLNYFEVKNIGEFITKYGSVNIKEECNNINSGDFPYEVELMNIHR